MSESERSSPGLFAFPISDPPLRFHRFLYEYGHQLGRAGGAVIHWRPIGDPAQCDDEYRGARTTSLEKRDKDNSAQFKKEVASLGSEDWLCCREYEEYAKELGVEHIEPPLVVFTASPLKEKAILKFEPVVFDRPEWTRKLAAILTESLTERAFSKLRKNGVFTEASLSKLQEHLNTLQIDIRAITEPDIDLDSLPASSLLTLREIKDGKSRKSFLARIVGNGPFEGVDKKLGARQLFFIYLLFGSEEERLINQVYRTVVTEERIIQELIEWSDCGFLRLSGPDKDKPAHRVMKMWGEFTRQFEKEPKLRGLFKRVISKDVNPITLYTLSLRVIQTQIIVANISSLFKGMTTL